ncbi:YbfB/YjiJ family MFS transporter [Erwinia sp. D4-22]
MRQGINLVAAAFTLTALSYGLARFAYGLLLPQIRAALSLEVTVAGWIGSGAFAAYCVGIIFTFCCSGKLSSRALALALAAGLAAT